MKIVNKGDSKNRVGEGRGRKEIKEKSMSERARIDEWTSSSEDSDDFED